MDSNIVSFDLINAVKKQIIFYLPRSDVYAFGDNFIKVHKRNLSRVGELSFSLKAVIWDERNCIFENVCNSNKADCMFSCKVQQQFDLEDKIKITKKDVSWCIVIGGMKLCNERCFLFLNRQYTFNYVLNQIFEKQYNEDSTYRFTSEEDNQYMNLSAYRRLVVKRTTKNMLRFSPIWEEVVNDFNNVEFTCGTVLDPKTGKGATLNLKDYKFLRSRDMQLIGICARGEVLFHDLFLQLGDIAVKVDLLEVKHTSPVNIVINGKGSAKGAAFILYNSARLQTLLRKFKENVEAQIYPPLPNLRDIDFLLLREEEEWQLFFVYVVQFPNMMQRCLKDLKSGFIALHILIQFLQALASLFSIYYRRIQILTQHRSHLMPTMYARIYLLKALQTIFNLSLSFLNIKPIEYM